MSVREAIARIDLTEAKQLAEKYFAESKEFPGTFRFTGAHFETLGAEQNDPHRITAADLIAVQNLSVKIPPARAAIGILDVHAEEISALLQQIPDATALSALTIEDFNRYLGEDSPGGLRLWNLLRQNGRDHPWGGIGPTIASKIMARKRPLLVPITDSVVDRVIGETRSALRGSWHRWWSSLTEDGTLDDYAREVSEHLDRPELSTLRTLDIVLWMWGQAAHAVRAVGSASSTRTSSRSIRDDVSSPMEVSSPMMEQMSPGSTSRWWSSPAHAATPVGWTWHSHSRLSSKSSPRTLFELLHDDVRELADRSASERVPPRCSGSSRRPPLLSAVFCDRCSVTPACYGCAARDPDLRDRR